MKDINIQTLDSSYTKIIAEYKNKQHEILKSFISGCIELGEILDRYHDELVEQKEWNKFLKEININSSQANQQIRLYKYSTENEKKELLEKVITNWNKLNLFLALDEDEKNELLEGDIITQESSNSDFKEHVNEIKDNILEYSEIKTLEGAELENIDVKATAKHIQRNCDASIDSIPAFEGIILIAKGIKKIQNTKISMEENQTLETLIHENITNLKMLLTNY